MCCTTITTITLRITISATTSPTTAAIFNVYIVLWNPRFIIFLFRWRAVQVIKSVLHACALQKKEIIMKLENVKKETISQ